MKWSKVVLAGLAAAGLGLAALPAAGAQARRSLQLVARILPRASLSLSAARLTFVGGQNRSVISAPEGPVAVTLRGRTAAAGSLAVTLEAPGGLAGPGGRIPEGQVACRLQEAGASGGALRRLPLLAPWRGGMHPATLSCVFKNPGNLAPGEYAGTLVVTLTAL